MRLDKTTIITHVMQLGHFDIGKNKLSRIHCHGPRLLAHPLATQSSPLRVNFFNSLVIY